MRTFTRPKTRYFFAVILLCLMGAVRGRAQVLAQRNWAGSGVSVEPWWRRAVFYRVDPKMFQDSNGDGKGDVAGLAQRLDYLQSLGVDALILQARSGELSAEGVDDLARAAIGHSLRVLVELGAPASQGDDAKYVAAARQWLAQGAAGLYLPTRALEAVDGSGHIALLLHQLRALTDSFPGGRVLLADAPSRPDQDLVKALAKETQLTASAAIGVASGRSATAASLRAQLTAALSAGSAATDGTAVDSTAGHAVVIAKKMAPGRRGRTRAQRHVSAVAHEGNLLLTAAPVPAEMDVAAKVSLRRALAVMLLASRAAVVLEYGQELGLDAAGTREPLMQWTAGNVTRRPLAPTAAVAPVPQTSTAGSYKPYIPPMRKDLFPPPRMPEVVESDEVMPVLIDPEALQGFTAGILDATLAAPNGATANVAMEQVDPRSLLNLYRHLIQIHHDNATVRNGAESLLDFDAVDAVVWVRRAPASSRTSATVVAACNLSDKPVALGDLGGMRVRGLRSLLSVAPMGAGVVAAGAVLVGETR
jgi:hypothetical protein